jgi:hypothetical protein
MALGLNNHAQDAKNLALLLLLIQAIESVNN